MHKQTPGKEMVEAYSKPEHFWRVNAKEINYHVLMNNLANNVDSTTKGTTIANKYK